MGTHWLMLDAAANPSPFRARLASVGRHLPATRLTTADLMASTRHHTHIDLERLTGIRERRIATGEEDSYTLAVGAARDCLTRSAQAASTLDVVINCSITKYRDGLTQQLEPTMGSAIADAVGAADAMTFDLSNACAGMLSGVMVLNNWIRRGSVRRGMVVSGEYISQLGQNAARHVRSVMSRELATLTLGDAGAAILLERAPDGVAGISVAGFTTVADHSRLCLAYAADHEPGARMFTQARAIHKTAIADLPLLLREALDSAGIDFSDVDQVIVHQTSARAIKKGMAEMTQELGGAPRHEAVITVDHYGNTASTTHTVALIDEIQAGRISPGETVALIALASGLEIGIILLTVDEELLTSYGHNH
jgi:3-oxoacyl-[acyl-carrier-protein] synthase-3